MQAETTTMESAVQQAWKKRPLIISGPCSAETEEQVLETAQRLKATRIHGRRFLCRTAKMCWMY